MDGPDNAQLVEYDELEDRIEDAATADLWTLADWLAKHVPPAPGERTDLGTRVPRLTLKDIEARGRRGYEQLKKLRKVALDTASDRLPNVAPRVYREALSTNGNDLAKANAALKAKGTKLRDQAGPMESVGALKRQLAKRTPAERAEVVAEVMEDEEAIKAIVKAATPKVRRRILDAEREQVREEAEAVDTYVPSDDSHQVTTFQDLLRKLKASDLPARIMMDAHRLLADLDDVDQFRFDYGQEVFDDDNGVEVTVNEFLDGVLENFGGRLQIAFAAAKGAPDNAEDV